MCMCPVFCSYAYHFLILEPCQLEKANKTYFIFKETQGGYFQEQRDPAHIH